MDTAAVVAEALWILCKSNFWLRRRSGWPDGQARALPRALIGVVMSLNKSEIRPPARRPCDAGAGYGRPGEAARRVRALCRPPPFRLAFRVCWEAAACWPTISGLARLAGDDARGNRPVFDPAWSCAWGVYFANSGSILSTLTTNGRHLRRLRGSAGALSPAHPYAPSRHGRPPHAATNWLGSRLAAEAHRPLCMRFRRRAARQAVRQGFHRASFAPFQRHRSDAVLSAAERATTAPSLR